MNYFRDSSALHDVLTVLYKEIPEDSRRGALIEVLEGWEWTNDQASLFASIVLRRNLGASADWVRFNQMTVGGSWVRGEQEGTVSGWLKTMKETWKFDDLIYEHKFESYEGYASPPSPYFQSSYSKPSSNVETGIWIPSDLMDQTIDIFVMSFDGHARMMTFEGVGEKGIITYPGCKINGEKFGRE